MKKKLGATYAQFCVLAGGRAPSVRRFINFIHSRFPSFQEDKLIDGNISNLW